VTNGTLALVGGAELTDACEAVDRDLLAVAGGGPVLVLPTAAAFEHPERAVANAQRWFASLGTEAVGLMVLARADAYDGANVDAVRRARFVYITGGSPMHLRSTLKATPLWDAVAAAYREGAVIAGSSAGAMVITDPMTDPRGDAFTIGLGLVAPLAVLPHAEEWSASRRKRALDLAGPAVPVVALASGAAAVRASDGRWRSHGEVAVYLGGRPSGLDALP
jgi:cyanophycinase